MGVPTSALSEYFTHATKICPGVAPVTLIDACPVLGSAPVVLLLQF